MRIGINADEANVINPVGIGQFALNVIRGLEKIDKENKYYLYLTSLKKSTLPVERAGWCYKYIWPKKLSTQFSLPFNLLLNREKLDVFFTPTHYAPRFCPMPSVVSVMDTSYLIYPEYFSKKDLWQLKNWTEYSMKNARKAVVISESTKKDVVKFYGKKSKDVIVCYPGYDEKFKVIGETRLPASQRGEPARQVREIEEIKKKYGIEGEYLIAIGTLQPRKNYERLIRVFAKLKKEGGREKLVIVGKKGWLYDSLFETVKKLNVEHDAIFTGYVPDEDIVYLLNGAKIYVLASLYEGFGIPILEAQACGVPVACSRVSSIPEVAGEAAIYFDPKSEMDMAEKINQLLTVPDLREKMRQKGLENVKKFSWETCAKQVLKTIEEAV